MADSSFGLKIGLEGEREFKRAITDINRSMKVLGSELKLVASEFGRNEKSAASLTARNQVLASQIAEQKNKIETLKAALSNAASSFGEADARTKNWQMQLNNAKAVLNELEHEVADNEKAIDAFNKEASESEAELKDAAKGADRLEREVDELGREMDDTGKKTSIFGDMLKANLASQAIIGGIKAIGSAIKAVGGMLIDGVKDGLAYNAAMQSYTTSFTTMLGDQAKAQQLVNTLKKEAAATPFGMKDLASSAQTLMSFGISADEAVKRMKQLGDISQGDAERFQSLTLAFAQMSSTGKLTGQDLMQMINAGFNPLEEISRKTGKSIGELKEEMSKGAISAEMVADAFESATSAGGRFHGAMEAQSKTFAGQMSTLQDNVESLKGQLTEGFSQTLAESVLPMVNGWVEALSQGFSTGGVSGFIDALSTVIKEALAWLSGQLPGFIQAGITILKSICEGLIQALPMIAEAAAQLVVGLVVAITELAPMLIEAALQVVGILAQGLGEALPTLIPAIVLMLTGMVQALIDNAPILLEGALQLITGLAEGIIAAIPVLLEALPALITAIVTFIAEAIPQIVEAGIGLLTSLVEALPQIVDAIVAAIPEIITALITAITVAFPKLVEAGFKLLTSLITNLPQIITTVLKAIPQIIGSVLNALVNSIPQLIKMGFELFVSLIKNLPGIIAHIITAIPQIIASIVGALMGSIGQIINVGANLVKGLWNGITSLASWLWNKVSGWISSIWDGICNFFGIHSPSREMAWVGQMLVRGLSGAIDTHGQEAVTAAEGLASDVTSALAVLEQGVNVPITANTSSFHVPDLAAQPLSTQVALAQQSTGNSHGSALQDLYALVAQGFQDLIAGQQLQVVLDDGTLVGHLAPALDKRLALIQRRNTY